MFFYVLSRFDIGLLCHRLVHVCTNKFHSFIHVHFLCRTKNGSIVDNLSTESNPMLSQSCADIFIFHIFMVGQYLCSFFPAVDKYTLVHYYIRIPGKMVLSEA